MIILKNLKGIPTKLLNNYKMLFLLEHFLFIPFIYSEISVSKIQMMEDRTITDPLAQSFPNGGCRKK